MNTPSAPHPASTPELDTAVSLTVQPALSVIVPVYGDWDQIPLLLAALSAQHPDMAPANGFEVILVDNDPDAPGPRPGPAAGLDLRVIPCSMPGSYAARNAGIRAARGSLLVFTDADCRPDPGWLAALRRAHADTPHVILAGPIWMHPGPDPGIWEIFDTVRGMPQAVFVRHGYAATANLAAGAALMARLGGFDPSRLSGGDAEFCRRAASQGVGLTLVPDAVIRHSARTTRAEVVTKARRIKGGQVASGPLLRRIIWTLRSLSPPLREMAGYLFSTESRRWPLGWRLTACGVRCRLWGIELAEILRLLVLRRPAERR